MREARRADAMPILLRCYRSQLLLRCSRDPTSLRRPTRRETRPDLRLTSADRSQVTVRTVAAAAFVAVPAPGRLRASRRTGRRRCRVLPTGLAVAAVAVAVAGRGAGGGVGGRWGLRRAGRPVRRVQQSPAEVTSDVNRKPKIWYTNKIPIPNRYLVFLS